MRSWSYSHRIAVMFNGKIPAVLSRAETEAETIGRIMVEGQA